VGAAGWELWFLRVGNARASVGYGDVLESVPGRSHAKKQARSEGCRGCIVSAMFDWVRRYPRDLVVGDMIRIVGAQCTGRVERLVPPGLGVSVGHLEVEDDDFTIPVLWDSCAVERLEQVGFLADLQGSVPGRSDAETSPGEQGPPLMSLLLVRPPALRPGDHIIAINGVCDIDLEVADVWVEYVYREVVGDAGYERRMVGVAFVFDAADPSGEPFRWSPRLSLTVERS